MPPYVPQYCTVRLHSYRTALENMWALSVQSVQAVVVSLSPVVAKVAVEWGDLYIAGDVIATVEV